MPLFPWFRPALAGATLASAVIAITILALIPIAQVPISTWWDKMDHGLAFFVLAALADHTWPQRHFWRWSAPLALAYGVGIEIAQWGTGYRFPSVMDVLADGFGIVAYGLVRFWASSRLTPASASSD